MNKLTLADIIKGTLFLTLSYLFVKLSLELIVYIIANEGSLPLEKWMRSLFIFAVVIICISLVVSKRREGTDNRSLGLNSAKKNNLADGKNCLSFTNSTGSLPQIWAVGVAILAIGKFINHHMFYSYYYFFAVGFIPLAYSFLRHSIINEQSLNIYFGNFFNRKCIDLPWPFISSISLATYETTRIEFVGGRIRVPNKVTEKHDGLLIKLNKIMPENLNRMIEDCQGKFLAKTEITIDEERIALTIRNQPSIGFRKLLIEIGKYADIHQDTEIESKIEKLLGAFAKFFRFSLIIMALIGLYFL